MKAKTAIYLRVSTSSQNLDAQESAIRAWLAGQSLGKGDVLYFSDKQSGANLDRPGFEELQAAIFNGEVKTVVVWKLDRLARSMLDGLNIIQDWCEQGVRLVSVTQQLDLSGTVGKMIASVLLGIGEMELEHIKERQAVGITEAKKQGKYKGRKPGTKKKIDENQLIALKQKGAKNTEIAKLLGVSVKTVSRRLKEYG